MLEESTTMPGRLEEMEQIDQGSIYARRIHHNAWQVGRDIHRYQQSMAETDAFLRDIENKGFAFLHVNDNDE